MNTRQTHFLDALPESSVAVVFSNQYAIRNYDVEYPFRQNSDFFYLTQLELSPAIWAAFKSCSTVQRILFYSPKPLSMQKWTGRDLPPESYEKSPHWDTMFPYNQFFDWLEKRLPDVKTLVVPFYNFRRFSNRLSRRLQRHALSCQRRGEFSPHLVDLYTILAPLRQIKHNEEIETIQKACDITGKALTHLFQTASPKQTEFQIALGFDQYCLLKGAQRMAFPTVVASGKNATVLHYAPQTICPQANDLILIDAGCEYNYYAADISRTFPIASRFTPAQRDIYQLVLTTQKELINQISPGFPYQNLQTMAIERFSQGLKHLGILKGSLDEILENKSYEKYYYHNVSHFLGIDVHDTGPYIQPDGSSIVLKPGMVLTVEPGLYFFDDDSPADFKGIGIRIEDDILVTDHGHKNLTQSTPKEIADIESLRT